MSILSPPTPSRGPITTRLHLPLCLWKLDETPRGGWVRSTSSQEVERSLLVLAQGALAWETRRTKGHISRSGTKGLKLRGQALRQVLRSQCGGITREGAGSTAASSSPSSVSVHRTSPDTEAVPVFAEHLPQGTTLRASCTSSPRILPAIVREATGLQVEEQPRRCGRRWASPPGCPSGRPLPRALALPSRHLTG